MTGDMILWRDRAREIILSTIAENRGKSNQEIRALAWEKYPHKKEKGEVIGIWKNQLHLLLPIKRETPSPKENKYFCADKRQLSLF